MAVTVTCQKVTLEDGGAGRLLIEYSDGSGRAFESLAAAKAEIGLLDAGAAGRDLAQMLLLAWWLARQPDGSNPNVVEGKALTLDLAAANPLKVQ